MQPAQTTGLSQADFLARLDKPTADSLLAYLNLPPLGCLDDRHGPPALGTDQAYELAPEVRLPLLERRTAIGGRFESLDQLCVPQIESTELAAIVDRLGDLSRYGQRLRPVWGGPESHRELFALLEGAQRFIHITMYIIGGELGLKMAELLARKVSEGVKVRVMFTASGFVISGGPSGTGMVSKLSAARSWLYNDMYVRKKLVRRLLEGGVELIDTAPVARHWKRSSFKKRGIKTAAAYYKWCQQLELPDDWIAEQQHIDEFCTSSLPYVDHRKMVVVDGERALIGSMNLADAYFYENELDPDPQVNRRRWQWHDNAAILEGGSIRELNRLFAIRWALSGGDPFDWSDSSYSPPPKRMGHAAIALEDTIPGLLHAPWSKNWKNLLYSMFGANRRPETVGSNPIRQRTMQLPDLAQSDMYIEHCYPSDGALLERWTDSAARLDNFTMLVPAHYDTVLLGMECDSLYPRMLERGARLMGYQRAIMHSKVAVADGYYVAMGSYNLTLRSATADLELQFFVQCNDYGSAVRDRIRGDLELSTPIKPTAVDRFRSRRSFPIVDALIRYLFF